MPTDTLPTVTSAVDDLILTIEEKPENVSPFLTDKRIQNDYTFTDSYYEVTVRSTPGCRRYPADRALLTVLCARVESAVSGAPSVSVLADLKGGGFVLADSDAFKGFSLEARDAAEGETPALRLSAETQVGGSSSTNKTTFDILPAVKKTLLQHARVKKNQERLRQQARKQRFKL